MPSSEIIQSALQIKQNIEKVIEIYVEAIQQRKIDIPKNTMAVSQLLQSQYSAEAIKKLESTIDQDRIKKQQTQLAVLQHYKKQLRKLLEEKYPIGLKDILKAEQQNDSDVQSQIEKSDQQNQLQSQIQCQDQLIYVDDDNNKNTKSKFSKYQINDQQNLTLTPGSQQEQINIDVKKEEDQQLESLKQSENQNKQMKNSQNFNDDSFANANFANEEISQSEGVYQLPYDSIRAQSWRLFSKGMHTDNNLIGKYPEDNENYLYSNTFENDLTDHNLCQYTQDRVYTRDNILEHEKTQQQVEGNDNNDDVEDSERFNSIIHTNRQPSLIKLKNVYPDKGTSFIMENSNQQVEIEGLEEISNGESKDLVIENYSQNQNQIITDPSTTVQSSLFKQSAVDSPMKGIIKQTESVNPNNITFSLESSGNKAKTNNKDNNINENEIEKSAQKLLDNVEIEEIKENFNIFRSFDKDQRGYLTKKDIHSILLFLKLSITPQTFKRMFLMATQKAEDNQINFIDFQTILSFSKCRKIKKEELGSIFSSFDKDLDGYLNFQEAKYFIEKLIDEQISEQLLQLLIKQNDKDEDKRLSFNEFVSLVM